MHQDPRNDRAQDKPPQTRYHGAQGRLERELLSDLLAAETVQEVTAGQYATAKWPV